LTVHLPVWHSHCTSARFTAPVSCSDELKVLSCPHIFLQLVSALFYRWPLLRNNNMETNLHRISSSESSSSQGCQVGTFKAKFQKFGLFWSCFAWKNGVWHVRQSLAFFWPFLMVLAWKNIVWHFLKPLGQRLLSAWNHRTFSQDKGTLFSATIPFSKIQATLPSKWRHRAKDTIFFGHDFENCGSFKQCGLGGFRKKKHKPMQIRLAVALYSI